MKLRCRLGLHAWEFSSTVVQKVGGETDGAQLETIRARCKARGCVLYPKWRVVNRERIR